MSNTPLRVLYVEDEPNNVMLLAHELRRTGFAPTGERVDSREEFLAQLDPTLDLILSDYTMPGFNGLEALRLMNERMIDLPFIFVSGTIGEDVAVAAMQEGAADFLIKDRLARLGPAVKQALARRRLKEDKLKAEQTAARLAAIVETSSNAILAKTIEGIITSWNPAAERLYGYAAHEILGRHISVLCPKGRRLSDSPENIQDMMKRLSHGEPISLLETVRVCKDGRRIEVLLSISPLRDASGVVTGASTIAHDITQQKRADRFLKAKQAVTGILTESKNLSEAGPRVLQTIAECLRWEVAVLWTVDHQASVLRRMYSWHSTWADAGFVEALSQKTVLEPGSGVAGRTWSTGEPIWEPGIVIHRQPAECSTITREGLRGGFGLPMRQGVKMVGIIEFYSPELHEPDQTLLETLDNIACQISQFCEQKRSLEELRISEQRFRNLVMALPAAVYTTDRSGMITLFNERAVELWGRRPELGRDRWCGSWKLLRTDGSPLPIDQCPMVLAIREGRSSQGEELIIERPDGSRSHVLEHPEPLRGAAGEIVGAINIVFDVSQMKQLEAQYRQSQKMEAVGQLAAGVAHDFNNLLTVILGYSDLFLRKLPADAPDRESIVQIIKAANHAAALTCQLLAFGRRQILAPVVLDLNALLTELEKMLRRLIDADVELIFILEPILGLVKVDPGQIEQVIVNLVVNARDAMPAGGRLTIRTQNIDLSDVQVRQHPELPPGFYTLLTVSDTGSGMDEATKAHIFEPFFTTKEVGKGTGLGLATVFGIVKQSSGFIEVDSTLGSGSTFRIYFPHLLEATPPKKNGNGLMKMPRGTETVLLVDDDSKLLELAHLVLEASGYKVLSARDGAEAMQICQANAGVIDLLFTDVVMPKMSGRQLTDLLVSLRPNMKVLYMSGYTDDTIMRHGIAEAGVNFLPKPFTPVTLTQKVREVLDGSNGQHDLEPSACKEKPLQGVRS